VTIIATIGFNVERVEYEITALFCFSKAKIKSLVVLQIPEYIMSDL
jgi:hypothetical protein